MSESEFEKVASAHYARLFRFAFSLAGNKTEACDLTQETFHIWARKGHQLRDSDKLESWLLTTLRRQFLMRRRHTKRFPHYELSLVEEDLPTIRSEIVERMDAATVVEALHEVDSVFRVPLQLFYFQDYSYKEIAEILQVPPGTVMSRLARGKEQIREALSRTIRKNDSTKLTEDVKTDTKA